MSKVPDTTASDETLLEVLLAKGALGAMIDGVVTVSFRLASSSRRRFPRAAGSRSGNMRSGNGDRRLRTGLRLR